MDMHNGIKKYSCDFCPKKFNKRNTLNNHKRLHTGRILNSLFIMNITDCLTFDQERSLSSAPPPAVA